LSVEKFFGRAGTLSIEVLGVDLLSKELLGKLLVDEFVELKFVKVIRTLAGLCLIFWNVVGRGFVGLLVDTVGGTFSNFGGGFTDRLDVNGLPVILFSAADFPSFSTSRGGFRLLGDGDLEEEIHDFRAKVANDSDTVFVLLSLSRIDLEIAGTGGASPGVVTLDSEGFCRSGEPPLTF
tara:strand:- start:252 stop:788 length:537 start_codon:yes stop_codon:yes gene_type:complete